MTAADYQLQALRAGLVAQHGEPTEELRGGAMACSGWPCARRLRGERCYRGCNRGHLGDLITLAFRDGARAELVKSATGWTSTGIDAWGRPVDR